MNIKKILIKTAIIVLNFALITFLSKAQLIGFEIQNGDILFQDGNKSDFSDAIKDVTTSIDGYRFSHCGICCIDNGNKFVIEALPEKGVVKTPIADFLNRYTTDNNQPKVVVGRLVDSLQYIVPSIIERAYNYLGKGYDFEFDFDNDKIYCSELVYFAFKTANLVPLFEALPMTFIDSKTNQTHQN